MEHVGHLRKMKARPGEEVDYSLVLDEQEVPLRPYLGQRVRLRFLGEIRCIECGKVTKKSWQQGHCFPCTQKLASCDICIVKPELCHYAKGTCREPAWGEANCLKTHVVYLANSSGLKVGITRASQVPTRWLDQGATQALPILEVPNRLASGQVEVVFGEHVADKTHWQKMLQGNPEPLDLLAERDRLMALVGEGLVGMGARPLETGPLNFSYPVLQWPTKVKSLGLEKHPLIEDRLVGIKGQYLMFENGVINVRNHAGHLIQWENA